MAKIILPVIQILPHQPEVVSLEFGVWSSEFGVVSCEL